MLISKPWVQNKYRVTPLLTYFHRFLPDNRIEITAHFLLHGLHHYLPMNKHRLVKSPILILILGIAFFTLAYQVF